MHWEGFAIPEHVIWNEETLSPTYGQFICTPFERGLGRSIGNGLRRSLLSSLKGAAVTTLRIEGVLHEYSTIPGVREDVTELILNVKKLEIEMNTETPKKMSLHVANPTPRMRAIKAQDIQTDPDITILNPDLHVAYLDKNGRLDMEMEVEIGRGFLTGEFHKHEDQPIGVLPIDSDFNPIKKVAFDVVPMEEPSGKTVDQLMMEVWTDGSIQPADAVAYGAKILKEQMTPFINFDEDAIPEPKKKEVENETPQFNDNLYRSVDELELSVRSANCLKNASIHKIYQLVSKSEAEMLKTKNFGRKSLNEIKEVLGEMDLSLGMKLEGFLPPEEDVDQGE